MRKRFIAGVLVLSMLLMGTGYAYWTDKLDILTVASTGELKVKFMDLALYGQYQGTDDETGWSIIHGIENPDGKIFDDVLDGSTDAFTFARVNSPDVIAKEGWEAQYKAAFDKYTDTTFNALLQYNKEYLAEGKFEHYAAGTDLADEISITVDDLYPGYAQVFQADIANIGTLAAKLTSVKTTVNSISNSTTSDMLGIALHLLKEDFASPGNWQHVDVFSTLANNDLTNSDLFFKVGSVYFLRLSALENISTELKNQLIYCSPSQNRMDVYFAIAMDPDAEGKFTTGQVVAANDSGVKNPINYDINSQNAAARVTVDFLWDQFNIDYDDELNSKTNRLFIAPPVAPAAQ